MFSPIFYSSQICLVLQGVPLPTKLGKSLIILLQTHTDIILLQTHSFSFLTQRTYSCSYLVAISSLVLELLKSCRVWQFVGHPIYINTLFIYYRSNIMFRRFRNQDKCYWKPLKYIKCYVSSSRRHFRRVHKIATVSFLSVRLSAYPHVTTRLPLDGYS